MKKEMKKILLNDLLNMQPDMSNIAKVRFNQSNSIDDPMDIYLREPELVNTRWLFWRTKQRYFQVGQIAVCLLKLSWDTWLLTTIKRVPSTPEKKTTPCPKTLSPSATAAVSKGKTWNL